MGMVSLSRAQLQLRRCRVKRRDEPDELHERGGRRRVKRIVAGRGSGERGIAQRGCDRSKDSRAHQSGRCQRTCTRLALSGTKLHDERRGALRECERLR